jgi:hypothetical protein
MTGVNRTHRGYAERADLAPGVQSSPPALGKQMA